VVVAGAGVDTLADASREIDRVLDACERVVVRAGSFGLPEGRGRDEDAERIGELGGARGATDGGRFGAGVVVARFCVSFFWLSAAAFDACFAIRASSARAMLNDSAAVSRVTGGVA